MMEPCPSLLHTGQGKRSLGRAQRQTAKAEARTTKSGEALETPKRGARVSGRPVREGQSQEVTAEAVTLAVHSTLSTWTVTQTLKASVLPSLSVALS